MRKKRTLMAWKRNRLRCCWVLQLIIIIIIIKEIIIMNGVGVELFGKKNKKWGSGLILYSCPD